MDLETLSRGPVGGFRQPLFGGEPTAEACGKCTDCCHLPEISVTEEEVGILASKHEELSVAQPLVVRRDEGNAGWLVMQGPCVFLSDGSAGQRGCRIYEERPGSCRVFTCSLRLALARDI